MTVRSFLPAAIPVIAFTAVAALFFAALQRQDEGGLPSSLVGKPAPTIVPDSLEGFGQAPNAADFETLKVKLVNFWAGHYAFNTLDHNVIAGPHNEVRNFIFANGFSGHGLQQSPAVGRGVSEWITYGAFRTLDLGQIGYDRVVRNEPFLEKAVI